MRAVGWMAMAIAALAAPQVLAAETGSQASLDRLADTLGYQYAMVDNGPECPAGIDGCFLSKIGSAHVCTPVTNAQPVCRLMLEKKQNNTLISIEPTTINQTLLIIS